jgi:hypothetical protein
MQKEVNMVLPEKEEPTQWRCPHCKQRNPKQPEFSNRSLEELRGKWVTCSHCRAPIELNIIYFTRLYDIYEMETICPHCYTDLQGPAEEIFGKPCFNCGEIVPLRE